MTTNPEQLLLNIRANLKLSLSLIAKLDQQVERKTQQSLALQASLISNIKHLKQQGKDSNTPDNHTIYQQIMTLQEEIEDISNEKVRIANSLHCQVANASEEVDSILGPIDPESENEEVRECLREEALGWCICQGEYRVAASGQCMVLCEGKQCPYRWFHIGCVGLTPSAIPQHWFCPSCDDSA